jgi:hypothetical protein
MFRLDDPAFVSGQYATDANLTARSALHEKYSTAPEHFHDWLFGQIRLPDHTRVLDIGDHPNALRVRNADSFIAYILLWDAYGIAPTDHALIQELRRRAQDESQIALSHDCTIARLHYRTIALNQKSPVSSLQ